MLTDHVSTENLLGRDIVDDSLDLTINSILNAVRRGFTLVIVISRSDYLFKSLYLAINQ